VGTGWIANEKLLKEQVMDIGGFGAGDVKKYLEGINFPASKEEVASGAESNGAPGGLVEQIKNAAKDKFQNQGEVISQLGL